MKSKILFIDDEVDILNAYKSYFSKVRKDKEVDDLLGQFLKTTELIQRNTSPDYEVYFASQGQEGIEIIKQHQDREPIKVCFVDMRMPPGMNGAETIKKIREFNDSIEIVLVTAYSDESPSKIAKELDRPDKFVYLKKPFDKEEILQLANNLTKKFDNEVIKDRFLRSMSHELKTPLSVISGFSQVLLDGSGGDNQERFLSIIYENVTKMNSLVDDLIMAHEMHSSHLKINRKHIQEEALFSAIRSLLKNYADQSSIQVEFTGESGQLNIDLTKLLKAFQCLLDNAVKFGEKRPISLNCSIIKGEIIFKICDFGVGIAPEFQEKIFEKFFRLEDGHHNVNGLGLGLYLAKEIIQAHDGTLEVESVKNMGTEFTCIL